MVPKCHKMVESLLGQGKIRNNKRYEQNCHLDIGSESNDSIVCDVKCLYFLIYFLFI